MDLIDVMIEGTMRAAAEQLRPRGGSKAVDIDKLVLALRRECKVAIEEVMSQAKDLLSVSPGWQKQAVNLACNNAARRAIASLEG
jgi:hypothetical protein